MNSVVAPHFSSASFTLATTVVGTWVVVVIGLTLSQGIDKHQTLKVGLIGQFVFESVQPFLY